MRMLRNRAAGTSTFCISILHLPLSHCFPHWLLAEVLQPCFECHRHLQLACTHLSLRFCSAFLLAPGIEDTFLDFEIILCKILPGMACRGTCSHHFHSASGLDSKLPGLEKQRTAHGCWQNRGENYPAPTAFSWTLLFSILFSLTLHFLTRFEIHFSPYIAYLPIHGHYWLSSDASHMDSFCCEHSSEGSFPSLAQEINDHLGAFLTEDHQPC